MLEDMKVGRRLAVAFGLVSVSIAVLSAVALWSQHALNSMVAQALHDLREFNLSAQFSNQVSASRVLLPTIMLSKSRDARDSQVEQLKEARSQYQKTLKELEGVIAEPAGLALVSTVVEQSTNLRDLNDKVLKLTEDGQNANAIEVFMTQSLPRMDERQRTLDKLAAWRNQRLAAIGELAGRTESTARTIVSCFMAGGILLSFLFGLTITRGIRKPIGAVSEILGRVAEGDLSWSGDQTLTSRKDEMGDLARASERLCLHLRDMVGEVSTGISTMATASQTLSSVAEGMATGAKEMSGRANSVAAAAEESSTTTKQVATAMDGTSQSLSSVASATEEMSSTIGEISANAEKGRSISQQATAQAQAISGVMRELGRSAQDIGKVTETITSISAQTNLLALNATIEAARAGASGKGFAVVANEIKELAQQTAAATEDIKAKISGIQSSAGTAIADIEKIAGVIHDVGDIVTTIASAIEEQSTATRDVASNIANASNNVLNANRRVAETAAVSATMATDIATVNSVASERERDSVRIQESAHELSQLSGQLKERVERFHI
jgi:methyl-accepting chemotaxis protein